MHACVHPGTLAHTTNCTPQYRTTPCPSPTWRLESRQDGKTSLWGYQAKSVKFSRKRSKDVARAVVGRSQGETRKRGELLKLG